MVVAAVLWKLKIDEDATHMRVEDEDDVLLLLCDMI